MYVSFLQSETLQNALIKKFKLQDRYDEETLIETRKKLKEMAKISADKKSGLISIEVDDKDPTFAADLANAHVDQLRLMLTKLAVTDAQQRRVFFEQQMLKTQDALAQAEAEFRAAKDSSGMQVTAVIAEAGVRASAELRAQIAAREVQLQALSRFATAQNPDVQRISSELSAMRAQLSKHEQGGGTDTTASPTRQVAIKAYREIKAREAMMGVLIAQYETARVDEAKEGPLVQQVDVAIAPEKKSKPKRVLIVVIATLAGLLLCMLLAFMRQAIKRARQNPATAERLGQLDRAWSWRKVSYINIKK
jgi:uncharacterized protein involved in exopolysaccharide biosynthesis